VCFDDYSKISDIGNELGNLLEALKYLYGSFFSIGDEISILTKMLL
jgi:hypothetical protein